MVHLSSTVHNSEMGEATIRELENQGLRLHREKQEYVDRLQTEASALREQIDKNQASDFSENENRFAEDIRTYPVSYIARTGQ